MAFTTPGLVYNPFGLSTTYTNPDYTFPGTPVDGWVLGVNGNINIVNDRGGTRTIDGTLTNLSSGNNYLVRWIGNYTANYLNITITINYSFSFLSLDYIKMSYIITNNSTVPLTDVKFVKFLDPDNDAILSGVSFTTLNGANNTFNYSMGYAISTGGNILNGIKVPTIYVASKDVGTSQGGYGGFNITDAYNPGFSFINNPGSEFSGDVSIGVQTSIGIIPGLASSSERIIYIGFWNSTYNPPTPNLN